MKQQQPVKKSGSHAKEKVLEAAISLFSERGYSGTSVREIVERAGVTKPVLYYYFNSKEGIFRAIMEWAVEKHENILTEVFEMSGTFLERITFLYRKIYREISNNRALFKLMHNLIFGPTERVPHYDFHAFHRRMADAIKSIYRDGAAKGEVRETEPDEVAFLIQGLADFCFHMDYIYPEKSDPERPERLLRLAFQGLGIPQHRHLHEVNKK